MTTRQALTFATLLAATFITASAAFASSDGGGQSGNGGGGVVENGQYMTFYDAKFIVNPTPKALGEIPGLTDLAKLITNSPYFSNDRKTKLLKSMMPGRDRAYFDVAANHFGPLVEKALKAQYMKATGAPSQMLVLYAVSDTNSGTTYLLPNFYKLKTPEARMAILFHEAKWMMRPNSSYRQIIQEESVFQAYLENPNVYEDQLRFVQQEADLSDAAKLAFAWDLKTGVITADGQIRNGNVTQALTVPFLLGANAIELAVDNDKSAIDAAGANATSISLAFPNSKFLQCWRDAVLNGKLRLDDDLSEHSEWAERTTSLMATPSATGDFDLRSQWSYVPPAQPGARGYDSGAIVDMGQGMSRTEEMFYVNVYLRAYSSSATAGSK